MVWSGTVKISWIKKEGRLNCPCGEAPTSEFNPEQDAINCACGRVYRWDGWIVNADSVEDFDPAIPELTEASKLKLKNRGKLGGFA